VSFQVEFSNKGLKQLTKLERDIQERVVVALERIRVRPQAYVKRLVGTPYYRLRVGDYRVILDVDNGKLIILVIYVGHRKKVYQ
jgi:mRNA interferase RelE/StbE